MAMASVAALTVIVGYVVVQSLTPRYTAEASVILEVAGTDRPVDVEAVVGGGLSKDAALINSEIDVLSSRELAVQVVDDLGLLDYPAYNPHLRPERPGLLQRLGLGQPEGHVETVRPERLRTEVVDAVLANLHVENDGASYTIRLSFEAANPELAAAVANSFADYYLSNRLERKHQRVDRTADWIRGKLKELRHQATAADQAVQQFREEHGLIDTADSTLTDQQLARVSTELADAAANRGRLEATVAALRADGEGNGDWIDPESADAALIRDLRSQRSAILAQLAELRAQLGPRHPQVIAMEERLSELQGLVRQEIARIVAGLVARVSVARAQEQGLRHQLADLTARRQAGDRAAIELRQLTSEADAARSLFTAFVDGLSRASAEVGTAEADARILSRAVPPLWPSFPPRMLLMLLAGVLAGLLALTAAAVLEVLDRSYRNPADFERAHGLPVLGLIPLVGKRGTGAEHPSIEVVDQPSSRFTDAVQAVYASLAYAPARDSPKVVLVTSAIPGEGKTALAIALGRVAARSRRQVLLIDCDLRRPQVATSLGLPAQPGLMELMRGEARIDQVLAFDVASGMAVLPVGGSVPFPGEVLSSDFLRHLFEGARDEFDLVIVDSPPVGVVADAALLGTVTDATLFAVRWGKTPRAAVTAAMHNFEAVGLHVTAAVFSHVDMQEYASYGYSALD